MLNAPPLKPFRTWINRLCVCLTLFLPLCPQLYSGSMCWAIDHPGMSLPGCHVFIPDGLNLDLFFKKIFSFFPVSLMLCCPCRSLSVYLQCYLVCLCRLLHAFMVVRESYCSGVFAHPWIIFILILHRVNLLRALFCTRHMTHPFVFKCDLFSIGSRGFFHISLSEV